MKKVNKFLAVLIILFKVAFTVFLIAVVIRAQASPQIYPSGVQYMGSGDLSLMINVYNPDQDPVKAELVIVRDLRQNPKDDIKVKSFVLNQLADKRVPVTFNIATPKTFWLCVRTYQGNQAVRDCSTIYPRKIK